MEQRDEHGHTYREFVRPTLTEADYQRLAPRWITPVLAHGALAGVLHW
jgi:hypothetical protein